MGQRAFFAVHLPFCGKDRERACKAGFFYYDRGPSQYGQFGHILWGKYGCGRSSGVEHNLAKVGVESSNLFARSNIFKGLRCFSTITLFFLKCIVSIRKHFAAYFSKTICCLVLPPTPTPTPLYNNYPPIAGWSSPQGRDGLAPEKFLKLMVIPTFALVGAPL